MEAPTEGFSNKSLGCCAAIPSAWALPARDDGGDGPARGFHTYAGPYGQRQPGIRIAFHDNPSLMAP